MKKRERLAVIEWLSLAIRMLCIRNPDEARQAITEAYALLTPEAKDKPEGSHRTALHEWAKDTAEEYPTFVCDGCQTSKASAGQYRFCVECRDLQVTDHKLAGMWRGYRATWPEPPRPTQSPFEPAAEPDPTTQCAFEYSLPALEGDQRCGKPRNRHHMTHAFVEPPSGGGRV